MWPQEGHFNNGAWEEATKQWDDVMGVFFGKDTERKTVSTSTVESGLSLGLI